MADLELFRFVRGIGRSVRDPLSVAYGLRLELTSLALDVRAAFDPYRVHSPEQLGVIGRLAQQQQASAFDGLTEALIVIGSWLLGDVAAATRRRQADAIAASAAFAPALKANLPSLLDELDMWLVAERDAPSLANLTAWLEDSAQRVGHTGTGVPVVATLARAVASDPGWIVDRLRIGLALVVSLYRANSPENMEWRARLTRLSIVASLLETLALLDPARLRPEVIYDLLHRRPLLVSPGLLAPLRRVSNLARRPGVADLYVMRQKWARYELGEIAAVEPIMPREEKERIFERTDETESTTTTTQSSSALLERDNQTSDRFEMSQMVSQAVKQSVNVDGWLNVDTEMPSTKVSAHVGADYSYSSESQSETATRHASEIVARVVSRIEESSTVTRTERRLRKVVDSAKHRFDNTDQSDAINGVYRWVDKVNLVEVVKYPNRFVFEVQIPEPAAWVRWLFKRQASQAGGLVDPGNFPDTYTPEIVSADPANLSFYLLLGARFGADSLPPPPAPIFIGEQIKGPDNAEEATEFGIELEHAMTIPDGYVAVRWRATVLGTSYDQRDAARRPLMHIAVGAGNAVYVAGVSQKELNAQGQGLIGNLNYGNIPVAIKRIDLQEYVVNLEVECQPSAEPIAKWKMEVWSALRRAHAQKRAAFEEAKSRAEVMRSTLPVTHSPARNKEMMLAEIKRLSIEMLTDTRLRGMPGMDFPNATDAPLLNRADARNSAAEIQFIEQVFEWSNLSYVFYPTYWTVDSRWPELFALDNADPEFAAFLRAGSVRVVIPVRPSFEQQAQLFVDYGILWGGGVAPGPEDPAYVSIATEIEEMQRGSRNGVVVRSWPVSLPTSLVALDATGAFPMRNPNVTLP